MTVLMTTPCETHVEQSICQLTSAVKGLSQQANVENSASIQVLLMEAQAELERLSQKCSKSFPDEAPEDDLALIESIPLQGLLGACFEQCSKKQSRQSTLSAASTMASLGGGSSPSGLSSTSSARSSCDDFEERVATIRPRFDLRSESPRPSLSPMSSCPAPSAPSSKQLSFMSSCMSQQRSVPQQPALPHRSSRSSGKKLLDVEPIHEEQDADDWELEFIRRSMRD